MKRVTILKLAAGMMMVLGFMAYTAALAQQEQSQTPEAAMAKPDAEGVFPALTHRGDIIDFLKFVGVACHKNIVPSPLVKGPVSVNLFDVTWKEALDAVLTSNGYAWEEKGSFIFVYTQKEYTALKASQMQTESKMFRLNYIPAKDVEGMIKPMLSKAGTTTISPEAGMAKEGLGSGETWANANFIIVTDYPENLEKVGKAMKELDQRPAQVLVEATILVASVNDNCQLGVDFRYLGGVDFVSAATAGSGSGTGTGTSTGGSTTIPPNATGDTFSGAKVSGDAGTDLSMNVTNGGMSIGLTSNNVGVFIKALESITDVVTLGNPKVLTLNRQTGKVHVGNEDGYITTEVSQTTSTQTVEFLKTGVSLTFRPFVMEDGFVRMELAPEDSSGNVVTQGGFLVPKKQQALVATNVLVQDGRTIVLGGLFRDRTTLTRSQVPLLGNIPLLGNLFRNRSDENKKEEVIFLITPHIVRENVDYAAADEVMDSANRLRVGAREGMLGISRQRLALAHYQQALRQKSAGNRDQAAWNAWLAAEMYPSSLEIMDYRNELRGEEFMDVDNGPMRGFMRHLIETEENGVGKPSSLPAPTSPMGAAQPPLMAPPGATVATTAGVTTSQ